MLLQHFSFGWQALDLLSDTCDLSAHHLGALRESRLMLEMPKLAVNQGACHSYGDAGPASDVASVRAKMHGPFVPYVTVSGEWALGEWYGAGGGQNLFKKTRGAWTFVKGWGGATDAMDLRKRFGVPVATGCKLVRGFRCSPA